MYGDNLAIGRRLGKHLPRIASGDAGDDWEADEPASAPSPDKETSVPIVEEDDDNDEDNHAAFGRPTVRERRMSAYEKLVSGSTESSRLELTQARSKVATDERPAVPRNVRARRAMSAIEPNSVLRDESESASSTSARVPDPRGEEGGSHVPGLSRTRRTLSAFEHQLQEAAKPSIVPLVTPRHLDRVPSSDKPSVPSSVRHRRTLSAYEQHLETTGSPLASPFSRTAGVTPPAKPTAESASEAVDDVAGLRGRLRLSRDRAAPSTPMPLPSAKLASRWSLWADTQRHLLHAYEYLCHVGEAHQWLEVCLQEALGFDITEMDDGLRNGVVLAKLVRAVEGEGAVKRIYEAPRLDFRHSENINVFVKFVREVGLPDGFIFELTDLYDKKNIPKVIYCIHALSHLLVRRGLAERMGNLLGQLQFSNDQLEKAQRGLKDAGVAMPNFGAVGRELAKEMNEEPEEEPETEDERRDRLLMESEDSIIAVQSIARAFLVRRSHVTKRGQLRFTERGVTKLQAQCRAALSRRKLTEQRERQADLTPWVIALQATARGIASRRLWQLHVRQVRAIGPTAIKVQAQSRGVLIRRRFSKLKGAMRNSAHSIVKLQSFARARIARRAHTETAKTFSEPLRIAAITGLQAQARGVLQRRKMAALYQRLVATEPSVTLLQARTRGALVRRRLRAQLAKLENASDIVIRIQAAARTYLARKRLLILIRGLRKATPAMIGLQARARAKLARQHHQAMNRALAQVQVVKSVGGFQALARAALMRNKHKEQAKQLDFVEPDVVGFQSAARGALVRQDFWAWRDYLWRSQHVATLLQAMLRGVLFRRKFRAKMAYYRANLDKVVKIQSLFRAKEQREQYRQLTLGTNVNIGTIKNFVHLLDDSEADFQEELQIERLRKRVVEGIREGQQLESEVDELELKIALVVQNVKSFEDLIKARRRHGAESAAAHAARASLLAAHGDPFAGPSTLDREAKRKLELYQQLFYVLQTKGEYLSRLFTLMSQDAQEKNRRLTERVALTLFGYGQDRREDYLLLKLFQFAIHDEIVSSNSIEEIIKGHPTYIGVAVNYVRPKQAAYVRETLQAIIRDVINAEDLDLEADPAVIYRTRIELEEMRTGTKSNKPRDLTFRQAIEDHPDNRAEYIRHMQYLQRFSETFLVAITQSARKMPFSMRYLARETLLALQAKYPDAPQELLAAGVGRLVYYRYINPAIVTPEMFDIVTSTIDVPSRKNLAQISRVLTQITSGVVFGEDAPSYLPINDFVQTAILQMTHWLLQVADVPDAETQYHAHEFLDITVQPKPIYISPNEVYAMHGLLSQHLDELAQPRDDPLRSIIMELGGVPHLGNDELNRARDSAITLELTNRFAHVRDPRAEEKTLWVQAKRGVLAILRVQPAKDLVEALMMPVSEEHEETWIEIVENEMIMDHKQGRDRRQPSQAGGEYRLEDIRSLSFREVKAHAIYFLLELEKIGKITRDDGYQGILNAIAGDVRSKHRKRLQRQQEMSSMNGALKDLAERKKGYEEQIKSYNDYVESAMKTMQKSGKGWKRFTMPFTKQYFHLRDLQKSGKLPQFGSFKYSAHDLYEKGILLSIDQYSPRQFDKIDIIISSNQVGIFNMEVVNNTYGVGSQMASADLRIEDLLQAQFENKASLTLFDGMAKVNLTGLLQHINKKFYI